MPEVTIWRDDAVTSTYYYLPMIPRFRMQDGKPIYNMTDAERAWSKLVALYKTLQS